MYHMCVCAHRYKYTHTGVKNLESGIFQENSYFKTNTKVGQIIRTALQDVL